MFSFHFLHLTFFSRSWQNSSTKRRGGHDIRFGRSPIVYIDLKTWYFCARVVLCTPCNDHWRANVLICEQWVWHDLYLGNSWALSWISMPHPRYNAGTKLVCKSRQKKNQCLSVKEMRDELNYKWFPSYKTVKGIFNITRNLWSFGWLREVYW